MKTIYNLRMTVMTPLHIGSGDTLEKNIDFVVYQKKTWMIDLDQLGLYLSQQGEGDNRFERLLDGELLGNLLGPNEMNPESPIFRYVIDGVPVSQTDRTPVKSMVKTPFMEPYLPGSSLKGALRTIIFREAFAQSNQRSIQSRLNNNKHWAAQRLEDELLAPNADRGQAPNFDLMRALQVSDSSVQDPNTSLRIYNSRVFKKTVADSPIPIESVRPNVSFSATITIDDWLFESDIANKVLRLRDKRVLLTDLAKNGRLQSIKKLESDFKFFSSRADNRAANACRTLIGRVKALPENVFYLQLGWGGGWESKTLAWTLEDNDKYDAVNRYRLGKGGYSNIEPFPRTRRAIGNQEPAAPVGWIEVEMTPR